MSKARLAPTSAVDSPPGAARRPRAGARPPAPGVRIERRRRLKESASEVYRSAILAAAERVFPTRGFAATKMADIARAAGLATGTLYNYFDSKERIFRSLVERRGDDFMRRLTDVAAGEPEPRARLRALVLESWRYLDEHQAMMRVFAELGAHSESAACRPGASVDHVHERFTRLFERAVRDGVAAGVLRSDITPADQVAFITGAMHGFKRDWMSRGARGDVARRAPLVLDLVINGLGGRP